MTHSEYIFDRDLNEGILTEIDQAIGEHQEWLQRWHRAVLCGLAPDRDVVSDQAEYLCRFGTWIEKNRGRGLIDQPAFRALDEGHRRLHARARVLALATAGGARVDPLTYQELIATMSEFAHQARRILQAFRRALSDLDPLTGLHNRQTMLMELERERARVQRNGGHCVIAIADLDHFKAINDNQGHSVGDRVLFAAANEFLSHLRVYDTVYRYGGEEFLFCLPNADRDTALAILDRLRASLADRPLVLGDAPPVAITASFGMAVVDPAVSIRDVIERADRALYVAKRAGRNRVSTWTASEAD